MSPSVSFGLQLVVLLGSCGFHVKTRVTFGCHWWSLVFPMYARELLWGNWEHLYSKVYVCVHVDFMSTLADFMGTLADCCGVIPPPLFTRKSPLESQKLPTLTCERQSWPLLTAPNHLTLLVLWPLYSHNDNYAHI